MFERLDRFIKSQAIRKSLKKRAPARFPYASSNDFYTSHLNNRETDQRVLIDSMTTDALIGRVWEEDHFRDEIAIPLRDLKSWNLITTRFYGYNQLQYKSARTFWVGELSLLPQRLWLNERFTQSYYNSRTRFRHERVDVLRKLVELHLEQAQAGNALLTTPHPQSIVQLLSEFYGIRIHAHPQVGDVSARFRLVIESLAASGDLKKTKLHEFQLEPQALETISSYEQDERRHRDSVRQNKRLFWITAIIAIATAVQAYSTFFAER